LAGVEKGKAGYQNGGEKRLGDTKKVGGAFLPSGPQVKGIPKKELSIPRRIEIFWEEGKTRAIGRQEGLWDRGSFTRTAHCGKSPETLQGTSREKKKAKSVEKG